MTTVTGRRGRRQAALAALVVTLLGAMAALPARARADSDFVAGSGSAFGSAMQVGGKAAGLTVGVLFGESATGYIGTAAQAASQTIDMGLLGTLLVAKQCDGGSGVPQVLIPQGIRVDSRDPGAAAGKQASYAATQAGSPVDVTLGSEKVTAVTDPRGHATTAMALATLPGVMDVHTATADTETGVVGAASRLARASVSLGEVDLFGGIIKLTNLRWTASQQTGKDASTAGDFTIGGAQLGGQQLPTGDPSAVLAAINQITSQVGITLEPPKVDTTNGVVQVTPLVFQLQSSPTEQKVTSPLLVATQPIRQAVFKALSQISCRFETLITVLDVLAGPVTGSGAFDMGLGGVTATTEGQHFDNPFAKGLGGGGGVLGATLQGPTPSTASGALGGSLFVPGTPGVPAIPPSSRIVRRTPAGGILAGARSLPGHTGGWAILVGFLAVAGVLGVAGADWWRLRRAPAGGKQ